MGIGMVFIVNPDNMDEIILNLKPLTEVFHIGNVIKGANEVVFK